MTAAIKGLGRGFESLIPTDLVDEEFDLTAKEDKTSSELKQLKLSDIYPDEEQPRREFDKDAIEALAASIKEHGVLQPIVVTREDGKYKIVAGERRWRASKIAGLTKIPAIIRTLDSQNRLELSIIENAQREDLNAIELATAYAKLKNQFNLTPEDIAAKVGKSETSINNTLRLLNLPEDVKKIMVKEKLTEGVMRPLVSRNEKEIKKVLPKIINEGWTSRRVERYFQDNSKKSSASLIKARAYHQDEDALSQKYKVPSVVIKNRSLTFKCKSQEELKSLIKSLL
ncbi:ParB/RepB/Spo0J family partition protein [Candidatus Saccharibacteria bacterium]|nr:ParB/RepB/Spo0J family partition protein [Candidatus Saccharibacteria bacterium]